MGLRNYPSEKLRQSRASVPLSAMKIFEGIDVISKRYPIILEQKVKLELALNHLKKFSTTEFVRCHSASQLKKFCANHEPDQEGIILSNDTNLDVDPFAPSLHTENKVAPPIQEAHPKHPPIDGV